MKLVAISFVFLLSTYAQGYGNQPQHPMDQLRLTHKETGKQVTILPGEELVCKPKKGRRIIGILSKVNSDTLFLGDQAVSIQELSRIRYFPKKRKWQDLLGAMMQMVGAFFSILFGVGIVNLLIRPIEGGDGLILFFSPLLLAALVLTLTGRYLSRRGRYSMKEWEIQTE